MTPTELHLLVLYRTAAVRLDEICSTYMNLKPRQAEALAAKNALGVPTFRLRESQKAPRMVKLNDLAEFIDSRAAAARENWETSQV